MDPIRLALVTISDGVMAGTRPDRSGDALAEWAVSSGHTVVARETVADEEVSIAAVLIRLADQAEAPDLILTTGGTGLTRRDVTPEATLAAIEREAAGIAEAIRARGSAMTPYAWLSRGRAGVRGNTLIVNLPGSEGGVRDGLAVLSELARHAVQLLRGIETGRHERDNG